MKTIYQRLIEKLDTPNIRCYIDGFLITNYHITPAGERLVLLCEESFTTICLTKNKINKGYIEDNCLMVPSFKGCSPTKIEFFNHQRLKW